jgi:succinate dehydrogenase / fumarate reductase cytochrome b subunit
MAEVSSTRAARPVYRNIHITQIVGYRLPPAGIVSILHRVSGALMFLLLPFVVWLFDASVTSEASFEVFASVFTAGIGGVPAWVLKLVVLALAWAYLFHTIAGLRHLAMDVSHRQVEQVPGRRTALFTLVSSTLLTLAVAAKLFGLY